MIELSGFKLILGGFHDHWWRVDGENPSLLLAALSYYHYDFMFLMDGPDRDRVSREAAAAFSDRIAVHAGREEMFGWGHVVTVAPRAPALGTDGVNHREVLRQLKSTCDLIFLAHPDYPGTWENIFLTGEMDRLLDEGLIDGVNLINTGGFDHRGHRNLIAWYRERDDAGKCTPIVGGWDAHMLNPVSDLPPVLYAPDRPPRDHIDTCGNNRTILVARDNSLRAITEAVRQGLTLIEDLQTGELIGPRRLVEMLHERRYRDAIRRLDELRDSVQLAVGSAWTAAAPAQFSVTRTGRVRLPRTLNTPETIPVTAGRPLQILSTPLLLQKDASYLPIAWHGEDGAERVWAVEVRHPIQIDFLPALSYAGPAIEIIPNLPFTGTVEIELEDCPTTITRHLDGTTTKSLIAQDLPARPLCYHATARSNTGITRQFAGHLTFFYAPRFTGDYSVFPTYSIDEPRYVPSFAFGASRPWPGPEAFSASLQFGWTPTHLLMWAEVRDAVHYQPFHGHYLYNADCLQLAIDPLLRRRATKGHIYCFNLALTAAGPELYRWLAPEQEEAPGFAPPPCDVSLGSSHLMIEHTADGLVYRLQLPWSELAPARPTPGARIGIYLVVFNNDGTGHLDTLHWPVPIDGMWLVPRRWGVLTLTD